MTGITISAVIAMLSTLFLVNKSKSDILEKITLSVSGVFPIVFHALAFAFVGTLAIESKNTVLICVGLALLSLMNYAIHSKGELDIDSIRFLRGNKQASEAMEILSVSRTFLAISLVYPILATTFALVF